MTKFCWGSPLRNLLWTNFNWKPILSMFISKYGHFKFPYLDLQFFSEAKILTPVRLEPSTSRSVVGHFINALCDGGNWCNVQMILYNTKQPEVTSATFYFCQIPIKGLSLDSQHFHEVQSLRYDFCSSPFGLKHFNLSTQFQWCYDFWQMGLISKKW